VIPTTVVLILRACAAGLQRWRLVAVEQSLTAVLRLAGIAGLALAGRLTPLSAVVVIAAAPVLGGLAYLPLRWHHRGPQAEPLAASTRHIVSYGSRIWIGSLTGVLLARLDQTIMTPLAGTYQLGLYAVAASVGDAALILHSAVRDVTFTADAARRDDQRLCASARISGFLSIAVALVLAALLPIGLPLVFGPAFAPAIPVAFWMLAAVVVVIPGSIAGAGLSARGHPGLRSMSLLVACALNVALLLVLVPVLGAIGAALATLAGNLIAGQLNIAFLSRRNGIPARQFYGLRRTDVAIMASKAQELARFAVHRGPRDQAE
jgi:O-antigen/teichoic acid export membrane protein